MDSEYKSFIKIFITGCLWGTIGLFVKLMEAQGSSSPYTSFLRLLFGFILLALMTLIIDGPKAFCIGRRTLLSCVLLGIICQGIFNILYSTSISMNGMSVGSVLLYTAPIFTCITSMLLFKEKMDILKWVALLVNVVGCVLTATGGDFSAASLAPLGLLIGVGAGFTYAMTAVIGRIAMQEESSPFAVATYNLFFGCLFIALVRHPWTTVDAPFNARLLLYGLLFGLIATALAYSIYFSGLSKITETGKVPVVASIELVVATIIGVFAFSESMTIIKIVGIVLVLLSILLFSWKTIKQDYGENKQDICTQKQDIHIPKQDIGDEKQDIQIPDELGNKTKQHIKDIFERFGYERFFGRTEVMDVLGITASPASALIKKMLDMKLIFPMKGKGKGKYLFKR